MGRSKIFQKSQLTEPKPVQRLKLKKSVKKDEQGFQQSCDAKHLKDL
jgi:hypothetical protein